jgi:hypothetical protein
MFYGLVAAWTSTYVYVNEPSGLYSESFIGINM